jgi:hypothetical protein
VTATEMLKCHQDYTIMQLVKIQIQIGKKQLYNKFRVV